MSKAFEYKHIVGFEETNLVGNVYYANFVRWQGRCREMFLYTHSPEVLEMLKHGFAMVTTHVSCEFISELNAFDELLIRMRLGNVKQNRVTMIFEYWRVNADGEEIIAKGEQGIACMQREGDSMVPAPVPKGLLEALKGYANNTSAEVFRRAV